MDTNTNGSMPSKLQGDRDIIKAILQEKDSHAALKDKLHLIIHEASLADDIDMDTDLINECMLTLDQLEEQPSALASEQIENMKQRIHQQYASWRKAQSRGFLKASFVRIAVSCLILFMITTVAANAFGYNLIQSVISWGDETFSLSGRPPAGTDFANEEFLDNLTDVFQSDHFIGGIVKSETYYQIEEPFQKVSWHPPLPVWIPDGFQYQSSESYDTAKEDHVIFYYMDGDDNILIFDYRMYKEGFNPGETHYQKDDNPVERYTAGGIEHYIFHNLRQVQAVWINRHAVVNVSGDITTEVMKTIIDSMYGEGDD